MTHWKSLANPNYLGVYSLVDGQDLVLTIKKVQQETVIGSDGKSDDCIVCYFLDSVKPMILNATNAKQIQKLLKTPYIEQWAGQQIQIGKEKVKAFGDVVEALRVRAFLPKSASAKKCEKCGKSIMPSNGMTPEQLAAYTKSKYGAELCAACALNAANEGKSNAKSDDR